MIGFEEALKVLKNGGHVTRKGWHKIGMYLTMQKPDKNSKMTNKYIYITIDKDYRNPWHPSQADMFAEDWIELV